MSELPQILQKTLVARTGDICEPLARRHRNIQGFGVQEVLCVLHCPSASLCCSVPRCPWASLSRRLRRFSILGGPVLSRSVSLLMGRLLHEELAMRWEQLLMDEAFTGGALAWLPGRTARAGQLVYPSGGALDQLCILSHLVGILTASTEWARGRASQATRVYPNP